MAAKTIGAMPMPSAAFSRQAKFYLKVISVQICSMPRCPKSPAAYSGDVGRRRSEATLVAFYSSEVAHMSQEKGK